MDVLISKEKNKGLLRQAMFLYVLKPYQAKYESCINKIVLNILRLIDNAENMVDLLMYLSLDKQKISNYLKYYL